LTQLGIFDEGTDTPFTPSVSSGLAVIDSIDINGKLIGAGEDNEDHKD